MALTSKERTSIRSALRQVWRYCRRPEIARKVKAREGLDICAVCGSGGKMEFDHIEPLGPTPGSKKSTDETWDGLIERLFCSIDNIQLLCHECHLIKTKAARKKKT